MRVRRVLLTLLIALPIALAAIHAQRAVADLRPTPREGAVHAVPLYGTVVRAWDAPETDPFAAGHRGIDVAAPLGTPVRASADGVVSFAGSVAGNRSVSIDHPDGVRSTYSFLGTVTAKKGAAVRLGDVIGTVGTGHPDEGLPPHVHLSTRRDGVYFDPDEVYVGTGYADLIELVA